MNATEEILATIDPAQLAEALGTDEETARAAAAAAIPTLITSLQANSATPEGQSSLLAALDQHVDGVYGESVDLAAVDTADGRRILAHAFADDPQRLQAVGGLGGGLLARLLPLLAPIVMSYLARKLGMGAGTTSRGGGGGGLGDLLGGLLGGAAGGGGLGDLLGQILGGGAGAAPASAPAPAGPPSAGGGTFTPGRPGQFQIPGDEPDPGHGQAAQPQRQGSGDPLGDLLGQILGR